MLGKVVPKIMVYGQYNSIQQKFMKGTRISSSAYITENQSLILVTMYGLITMLESMLRVV